MDWEIELPLVGDQNTIVRGFDIPWLGGENTMDMGFNIPWVGVKIPWIGGSTHHG